MATNAVILDGVDQYLKIDNFAAIDALTDGTFTLEFWFNQDSSGSDSYASFMEMEGDDFCQWFATENAESSTGCNFGSVYSVQDADGYVSSGLWTNGNWVHIALIVETGEACRVLVNGVEVEYNFQREPNGTPSSTNNAAMWFGVASALNHGWFKGKKGGFIRVWSDVRTDQEIDDNKALGLQASGEDNLIINIKFSEGSGTYSENEASSGNDLDFYNTPSWTTGPTITEKSYGPGSSIVGWKSLLGVGQG